MEPIFLAREIRVKSKYDKRQNKYFVCLVTFMDLGHTGSDSFLRTQRMCGITMINYYYKGDRVLVITELL